MKFFNKTPTLFLCLPFVCMIISGCTSGNNSDFNKSNEKNMSEISVVNPPKAKKINKELAIHGDVRIDPYYWLNDREDQEVIDYLNAENEYTKGQLAHTKTFQDELFDEIVGRIKKDDTSVPYKKNGYYYLTRYEKGGEYPIHSRKKGSLESPEEIMINVNELAKPFAYYAAVGLQVSPDNELLSYGEDTLSRRIYNIRFKNLKTGEMLEDLIPNTTGRAVWANDNKTLFYAVKDETLRSYKIFKHKLGTDAKKDVEIYHEKDDTYNTFVYKTKSDRFIVIGSYHTLTNEYRIVDANHPDNEFKVFQPRGRENNLEYSISHYKDKWYIRTNLDAQNFRLMETPVNATGKANWKEVIPHREDVFFEGVEIFDNYLVLEERKEGIVQLRIRSWDGKKDHYIDFGEDAYMTYTSMNPEFDTDIVRIGYQSMTTPPSTFDYNMATKKMELLKQQEVVGDFDPKNYKGERLFAKARDGVKVPISLVYKKGTRKDGPAPLLLYGYGSYGNSMEPYFSSTRLSLLDRGFIFAIAHIRGGQEMGRQWYEDGKLLKKKNTFTDFIDCGEYLIQSDYTSKDQLFGMGGSAGGLLMGAVVNLRPDLWKGIIAAVPFVDVITTMLDESIPLTTGEFDEWGNPKDKTYYDYIKSYSPYDNLKEVEYPNMLVTTGLHDSQVQYWEPAKWVAKLREVKKGDNLLLLYTDMEAGHGGASGRFKRHRETAMEYAFFLDLAGKIEVKN